MRYYKDSANQNALCKKANSCIQRGTNGIENTNAQRNSNIHIFFEKVTFFESFLFSMKITKSAIKDMQPTTRQKGIYRGYCAITRLPSIPKATAMQNKSHRHVIPRLKKIAYITAKSDAKSAFFIVSPLQIMFYQFLFLVIAQTPQPRLHTKINPKDKRAKKR